MLAIVIGLALIVLGALLIAIGALLSARSRARCAGVVIVGPIPLLFATDKEVAKLAVALTALAVVFFLALIALQLFFRSVGP